MRRRRRRKLLTGQENVRGRYANSRLAAYLCTILASGGPQGDRAINPTNRRREKIINQYLPNLHIERRGDPERYMSSVSKIPTTTSREPKAIR